MSYGQFQQQQPQHVNPYSYEQIVANATVNERVAFIRRTYMHLTGAIMAFVLLQSIAFTLFYDQIETLVGGMFSFQYGWLIFFGAFLVVSWIANWWAHSDTSRTMQYMGLGLYVVAEALIFVPMLYIASTFYPGAISSAAIVTTIIFVGLTATVFISKADFSFLRMALVIGSLGAFGLIIAAIFFPINLGFWFAAAMVVLASGFILYETSNILHHYRTSQHVAASLALFASVALLFWYVLQMFMSDD